MLLFACILLFATGCASGSREGQYIVLKNGRKINCELLAVRDNALIVNEAVYNFIAYDSSKAVLYHLDSIDVYRHNGLNMFWTSLGFGMAGTIVGRFVGEATAPHYESKGAGYGADFGADLGDGIGRFFHTMNYAGIGGLTGILSGVILSLVNQHAYDPRDPNDREQIAKLAIYKTEEPDELKKIK